MNVYCGYIPLDAHHAFRIISSSLIKC